MAEPSVSESVACSDDTQFMFFETKEQFEEWKWQHEVDSKSHFVSVKTSINFGNTDLNKKQHKLQWRQSETDHPYIVLSDERYECHHGPDRNKTKKNKSKVKQVTDHTYEKRRFHLQPSKKMNCPASIIAKEIVIFTEFKASVSKWKKEQITKFVKEGLKHDLKDPLIKTERKILVKVPLNTDHKFHLLGEVEQISMPIDKRVIAKIEEYVTEGFVSASSIRPLSEYYVKKEIFTDKPCPPWTNRRFFPSQKDIANIVYQARLRALKSKYDQENLLSNIDDWKRERPEDCFYFVPSCDENILEESEKSGFLFIYQSEWQRRLLRRYGNELCFMDATYRTTKYSIPLFFVCVKTNVDYCVVAVFASQSEDSETIHIALSKLKEWNSSWKPQYFMVDYCEAEINGIKSSFPDCKVFICDFHREQAWNRWLKASKHCVQNSVDDIKSIMKRSARASTIDNFQNAVEDLKNTTIWNSNKQLRDWFTNTWLKNAEMWAWVFRQDRLNIKINTNNGVERQNRTFKYDFLSKFTDRTLTGMLCTVILRYLPDQYRSYMQNNIKGSSLFKIYSSQLPEFLHNRPREFVDHCRKRISAPEDVTGKMVKSDNNIYHVRSFTNQQQMYNVFLGSEEDMPSCQCHDWLHTHWPCKHMMAVVMHHPQCSWNDVPVHYRDNPLFTLDESCMQELQPGSHLPTAPVDVAEETGISSDDTVIKEENTEDLSKKCRFLESTIREELEQIRALSYLSLPYEVLVETQEQLHHIRENLCLSTEKESNIPLLNIHRTVKSTTNAPFGISKRKPKLKSKVKLSVPRNIQVFKALPLRKRRKSTTGPSVAVLSDPQQQSEDVMEELISGTSYLEFSKHASNVDKDFNLADIVDEVPNSRKRQAKRSVKDIPSKRRKKHDTDLCQNKSDVSNDQTDENQLISKLKAHMGHLTTDKWKELSVKGLTAMDGMKAASAIELAEVGEHQLISLIKSKIPVTVDDSTLVTIVFNLVASLVNNGDIKLKNSDDPEETAKNNRIATRGLLKCMTASRNEDDAGREVQWKPKGILKKPLKTANDGPKKNKTTACDLKKNKTTVCFLDDKAPEKISDQELELSVGECEIILQKNWNKRNPSDYVLAKVHNVNVTDRDVLSLQGSRWLTDQIVDAYLAYLAQAYIDLGGNVLHVVTRTFTAILNGEYNKSGRTMQRTKFLKKKTVIGAYLQSASHWDLVVIEPFKGKVYFYNPLGETKGLSASIINNWSLFMKARKSNGIEKDMKTWTLECPQHTKQKDSSNCGVYTLMFAERHLHQKSCLHISGREVITMRRKIGLDLLQFSGHLKNCCRCCGWEFRENQKTVNCEQCRFVFHRSNFCVGEHNRQEETFICKACV